jgi:hypothetical protein
LRSVSKSLYVATLLAASTSFSGSGRNPESHLRWLFPGRAAQVLAGDEFSATPRGFVPRPPPGLDPVKAAEASLLARGGLRLSLPSDGGGLAGFSLPGGFALEVRERGLGGKARSLKSAVAYSRPGGESYWTAVGEGYEAWVLVEDAGAGPVAEWEVRGASLRQAGEAVEIVDGAGATRMRVTAPAAFARARMRGPGFRFGGR